FAPQSSVYAYEAALLRKAQFTLTKQLCSAKLLREKAMRIDNKSISAILLFFLFMGSVGFMNHVIVIPAILDIAGRDAWTTVLMGFALLALWTLLPALVVRKMNGKPLNEWLRDRTGPLGSKLILTLPFVALIGSVAVTLFDTLTWTRTNYLPETPLFVTGSVFMLLCLAAAASGLSAITLANGILLPFVILFGLFVMTANIPDKHYDLLIPVFEKGPVPAITAIPLFGAGYVELVLIVLLQHRLKRPVGAKWLLLIGFVLAGLTLGPIMGAISEFGPAEAAKQRYPAYEQWRLVQIGKYIEHVDFLSIYQWMTGAFIRISLSLYLLGQLSGLRSERQRTWLLLLIGAAAVVFAISPISDASFYYALSRCWLPASFGILFVFSLAVTVASWLHTDRGRSKRSDA
ncbi:MAG: spore germination protein, partial [Paenibacillus sp.]|nr:spore germination protein [Paenibacillus sp.]